MKTATLAEHRRAIGMLVVANLLWGLSFPLMKAMAALQERLIPESSTWFITATALVPRFAVGALVIGIVCFRTVSTLTRLEWKQGIGLGAFAVVGMVLQNDGLQFTSASTSAFLTQFYAIMIPPYFALRRRIMPPWTVWVSCVLVLIGAGVLAGVNSHDFKVGRGELETLAGSFFFMGQILWLERPEFTVNRALGATFVMFAVEAVVSLGMTLLCAPPHVNYAPLLTNVPWLAFTGALTLLCTLGAFTIMNVYQPRITATEAGLLYTAEPVFTAMFALFLPAMLSVWGALDYPNEVLTMHLLVGGALLTLANILVQLKPVPPAA